MIRHVRTVACFLLSLTLIAAGAETQRKRGGFQPKKEATPKPAKKKSAAASKESESDADATPKPKKKRPATETSETASEDSETKPKSPASKKGKSSEPEPAESPIPVQSSGMLGPIVATLAVDALEEFNQQPAWLQGLIHDALSLTELNLGYLFGSADPQAGGMDCSGTIYYLLHKAGYKDVPRDSGGQYGWIESKGTLRVVSPEDMAKFDSRALRPGDLLFWTGTYSVTREFPITHVMLFLGREKATGKPIMWGASDGRSYAGIQRYGVSVFDFKLPKTESKSKFVGFGQLPVPH